MVEALTEHEQRLVRIVTHYGNEVVHPLRLVPDQPTPQCETDWLLFMGDHTTAKHLFPSNCKKCGVGGYDELDGVTDAEQASRIIEAILSHEIPWPTGEEEE